MKKVKLKESNRKRGFKGDEENERGGEMKGRKWEAEDVLKTKEMEE